MIEANRYLNSAKRQTRSNTKVQRVFAGLVDMKMRGALSVRIIRLDNNGGIGAVGLCQVGY